MGGPGYGVGGSVGDGEAAVVGDGELRRGASIHDGTGSVGDPDRGPGGDCTEPYPEVPLGAVASGGLTLEESEHELAVVGDERVVRGEHLAGGDGGGGCRSGTCRSEEHQEEHSECGEEESHGGEPLTDAARPGQVNKVIAVD